MVIDLSRLSPQTVLGQWLRWPLNLVPGTAVVPVLQGPLKGARWIVGSSIHGCWLGTYENRKAQELARVLEPGDVVLDIGAHVGYYTLLAARAVAPHGHVHAFEPNPSNLEFLRQHIRLNAADEVVVWACAVSDRNGPAAFSRGSNRTMSHLRDDGELIVRSVSIDALLGNDEIQPPSVLKIDVEGGEERVLEGASATLAEYRPDVFVATHGRSEREGCLDLLRRIGYQVRALDGADVADADEFLASR